MKMVLQRVASARVEVDGAVVGAIGQGLLVLLGIAEGDSEADIRWGVEKVRELRIFSDSEGKFNLSLSEIGGEALVVSQFTLLGDARKGRRPSFAKAARPEEATPLYDLFVELLRQGGTKTETGIFGARMQVHLVNDGPVTLVVEK
ncbi:MAG: D-tyrosyl-tRNA(Tyr) deacylase [Calditrichaeota bacterium]|nr:D-tyrosyl-tRNA(Tyr) deacylase [Calditrichota bacterium]MCB9391127.1 D-tyrosyl-tRNA(Tyr) deacylase [Calditrichota bacterium]